MSKNLQDEFNEFIIKGHSEIPMDVATVATLAQFSGPLFEELQTRKIQSTKPFTVAVENSFRNNKSAAFSAHAITFLIDIVTGIIIISPRPTIIKVKWGCIVFWADQDLGHIVTHDGEVAARGIERVMEEFKRIVKK